MLKSANHPSIELIGVKLNPINFKELFNQIDTSIKTNGKKSVIGYTNLHGLYLYTKNKVMSDFYKNTTINYIDGMPIVWLSKALGYSISSDKRMTLLDFVYDFFEHCKNNNYNVLWIGGEDVCLKSGISHIKNKIPGITLTGVDGYQKNDEYLQKIESIKPDILLVGLGMPRQEEWILANKDKIDTKVIWCIGATIDYLAGKVYTPPRWAGKVGLEWAFRLASEPRRLWFRYIVEPFIVIFHLAKFKRNPLPYHL